MPGPFSGLSREEYFRQTRFANADTAAAELRELADEVERVARPRRPVWADRMAEAMSSPFRGWPMCGVCGLAVERVLTDRDIHTKALVITAVCHGESEEVVVEERILHETKILHIGGTVFARPRLEGDGDA